MDRVLQQGGMWKNGQGVTIRRNKEVTELHGEERLRGDKCVTEGTVARASYEVICIQAVRDNITEHTVGR